MRALKRLPPPLPLRTFQTYIESAIEAAHPKRILLMLDEFDKLHEGIENGVTNPQVPRKHASLVYNINPVCLRSLRGSRRLKKLREEYWSALFGLGVRIGISAIPEDAARKLVHTAGRRATQLPATGA